MRTSELCGYGIPREAVALLEEEGIEELYPPQEEAVRKGLLGLERSFLVSVPTASGKTLIAELLMLRALLERGGKCLYVVPLRALASEKAEEFKRYERLGIGCAISTGDYDTTDSWLAEYQIVVTTSEKADSLLRHNAPWLKDVKVLVADEIHLIHDAGRGPTLEVTIARLRHLNPQILVLGLSATVKNAEEIAAWLGAELVRSDWRPVPLREGVYYDGEILFSDSKVEKIEEGAKAPPLALALDVVKTKGQGLIFVNTRAGAERTALDLAPSINRLLGRAEEEALAALAEELAASLAEPTRVVKRLGDCVRRGTAFHHAGLTALQRRLVEGGFKSNLIKILAATPTLAAGVNLPARRVVIREHTRYEAELGKVEISVLEYKQMCGRAGRPKYDSEGEAILIAKSPEERTYLLDNYVLGEPERIYSKLGVESALRTHVLATIALGYASSPQGLLDFFSRTFFAHQQELYLLEGHLDKIVELLLREGLCEDKGGLLEPTPFGRRACELYIDPLSAVTLRDGLFKAREVKTSAISYLQLIAALPEIRGLYLRARDYEPCIKEALENESRLLLPAPSQLSEPWRYEEFLAQMKTALLLRDWIDEHGEDFILEKYSIGPGDLRNKIDLADWLLYASIEVGRLFRLEKMGEIM
ncbi:MAG: DEAD/DEAH box helicase, partial [Euryarchaeota archaeon]|nr:DEAD/DEAH box helicase [Euryarchaeota archaeon]